MDEWMDRPVREAGYSGLWTATRRLKCSLLRAMLEKSELSAFV